MALSVFDLFSIGIGPSSSHTVGPMRAAHRFASGLADSNKLSRVMSITVELFGSLGATGRGHGSVGAIVLGLMGEKPESVDVDSMTRQVGEVGISRTLPVLGRHPIPFVPSINITLHRRRTLAFHSNGMEFRAFDANGVEIAANTYFSIGGGFVVNEGGTDIVPDTTVVPHPFGSGAELLGHAHATGSSISEVMWANERVWRTDDEIRDGLLKIWSTMQACVERGCATDGVLPGLLLVPRRAHALHQQLLSEETTDPLTAMDWVNLYALAVNEENAAGGRVVTAPTNGAAGIIPAVMHYYWKFVPGATEDGIVRFLLTAGAIGVIYKTMASISGAEVGCQGEVGSACSMAAGALTEVLGGTPRQVENAAEIAMEHNLGLTCDPVGGLVQIPCIERNAMASVKAINAARLAQRGDGSHMVSLDQVIVTMRETGADMKVKYKETSRGGLAVNVIEC
jgi:L-serine dehydratase